MPRPAQPSVAQILERCARDMHDVAFDFHEDPRIGGQPDERVHRVERIVAVARAAVRGGVVLP